VIDPAFVAPLPEARKLRKVFTGTFCGLGNHVDRSRRAANEAAELIAGLLLPLEERLKRLEQENRELRGEIVHAQREAAAVRRHYLHEKSLKEAAESRLAQVSEALRVLSMVALQTPLYQTDPDMREAVDAGLALTACGHRERDDCPRCEAWPLPGGHSAKP
jgi:hypothetical protein